MSWFEVLCYNSSGNDNKALQEDSTRTFIMTGFLS
jgi:hypothetical protein